MADEEELVRTTVRVPAYVCKLFTLFCNESIPQFLKNSTYDPSGDVIDNNFTETIQVQLPKKQYEELREQCTRTTSQYFRDAMIENIVDTLQREMRKNND